MKRSSTIQILKAIVVVTLFLLLSGSASVSAQENVVLPRYPALSPDGHTLVFAYQGDLWSAPLNNAEPARRLTSHPAYESRPMFSPDGKEIAFQSNRFGRNEVFVMPASGGAAKRLTNYSAAGTTLQSWAAGGKKVMVGMTRELARRGPALYFVDNALHAGRPKPILALNSINGAPGYPVDRLPYYPWHKPAVLLINESSYSNAEIFAHAFHTIGRGLLIGKQTFGAVLSTGTSVLLDGSTIRTPGRGWYNIKTGDSEEHDGARPDIAVEITPSDELTGRDPQLEAAAKTLLKTVHAVSLPAAKAAQLGTSAPK